MSQRTNFGKIHEVAEPPNLIEIQLRSYEEFLQKNISPSKRKDLGLQAVFREVFPITSYDEKMTLDFVMYEIGDPKLSSLEAIHEAETFSAPLYVTYELKDEQGAKQERVYMGEIPLMTVRGTFVINGAERVVVSQLHRSPGICFETSQHLNGRWLHGFRIIPDRGTWLEVQFDTNDLLYVYLDRRRRRRKFLATTLLRVIGFPGDEDILKLFYEIQDLKLKDNLSEEEVATKILFKDILDGELIVARAYEPLTSGVIRQLIQLGHKSVKVVTASPDDLLITSLRKDTAKDEDEALKEIYRRLRPGDPPTTPNARALVKRLFFDPKRYDLTRVGRYKINQKLSLKTDTEMRILTAEDVISALRYLFHLREGQGILDDIDHLGSRRVRAVGELLANQCRVGLSRTERLVKERMTLFDVNMDTMTPAKLVNPKALSAVVRDFFGRSQLSQFMDQINPLAELTHKRRLSALGPGGLNRDRAGFEVRDVHPSHYGRICPIETPEGPNIGLINSLGSYARINEFGFIETPYRPVKDSVVADKIDYLTADQEEKHYIAQSNNPIDDKGHFKGAKVTVRYRGEFIEVEPSLVTLMDVSPKQLVSVAAALIPFLEHDDANRALMGSNMQRQGVPLLEGESPLVGTGMEGKAARDSRSVIVADANGTVAAATADVIIVTKDGNLPIKDDKFLENPIKSVQTDEEKGTHVYPLRKFGRSNAGTCINQKPLVKRGQKIKKGDVIADGPCTDQGELAIGKNMLVAFMPWNGYNFEDAITISRRVVKEDIYTSIHIEDFEVIARDTKLGPEEITRDIPNVGDEALKNLDAQGVVRIGAEVKPGDILVGKITPKSETELAPEERLLRAIFGEKAADVKDTSLRVPSGCTGIIMDVRIAQRGANGDSEKEKLSPSEYKKHIKQIEEDYRAKKEDLTEQLTERLSDILLNEKIPLDIVNGQTGEPLVGANKKITKTMLRHVAESYDTIEIDPSPIRNKIFDIIQTFEQKFSDADMERERNLDKIESSEDTADSGVVKQVRVFLASKRKLSVGDKMAGRHGNKGIVANIVPEEDMPFLENGTPVDIVLNPLGVPSRMNVGQVLETHLGLAAKALGMKIATPVFDGIPETKIMEYIKDAKKVPGYEWMGLNGKSKLYDGRTGDAFSLDVVVGYIYMLKLNHLVADKIHARAVGPYSLVTQQPLGGKAQYGGQRFGEMEVWALEAYGAAFTLQELLTVKSDDVQGRTRIYEQIVKGDHALEAGTPESFNVLIKEMQSLGLDVKVHKRANANADVEALENFASTAGA
ncbi:DNA-directed RNA polymerase subunit beta [Prosthecobacter sp.]|uniref:DNA-directed RNA polymerase subunit beta n=1 Tax=Prosthecobacter sp. TaxID=1965333 RepID=UPI003782EE12